MAQHKQKVQWFGASQRILKAKQIVPKPKHNNFQIPSAPPPFKPLGATGADETTDEPEIVEPKPAPSNGTTIILLPCWSLPASCHFPTSGAENLT
jgi:hypothetical protein